MSGAAKEKAGVEPGNFGAITTKHEGDSSACCAERKEFATLQARFAMVGHVLYRVIGLDGRVLYVAGRWGYLRELPDLAAVSAFLALIGGAR